MLLQVHDELLLEVPASRLDAVKGTVRDAMEHVFPLRVPLKVDVRDGANWTEAH
jgi:DNA polymerase-1